MVASMVASIAAWQRPGQEGIRTKVVRSNPLVTGGVDDGRRWCWAWESGMAGLAGWQSCSCSRFQLGRYSSSGPPPWPVSRQRRIHVRIHQRFIPGRIAVLLVLLVRLALLVTVEAVKALPYLAVRVRLLVVR